MRRELRSVTSNTRADGREFLALAARHGVRATTHTYPLSKAQRALRDLKACSFPRRGRAHPLGFPDRLPPVC